MIKTADQLGSLAIKITQIVRDSDTPTADILHILMDEQLDAIKHGMTLAAEIASKLAVQKRKEREERKDTLDKLSLCGESLGAGKSCVEILTARDNLKEI